LCQEKREEMITQAQLKELFSYDPETGVFTRKVTYGRWKAGMVAGTYAHGYVQINIDHKLYYAHRLAWLYVHGEYPSGDIDHIDHNTSNNSMSNLRNITTGENLQNQIVAKKNNQSRFLGVHFHAEKKKYQARIQVAGKQRHLGYFDTPEFAYSAYVSAKRELHSANTL